MIRKNTDLQFFFCIGCQKTGTTLLARVLDQHPNIACIWESYLLKPDSHNCITNLDSYSWSRHGFSEEDVQKWAKLLSSPPGIKERIIKYLTGRDYARINKFRQVAYESFSDFAYRCGASVVGDKWPWYINHIDIVLEAFPNAKFIYNVRDPRSHWNSAQRFKERKRGDEILKEMLRKDKLISPYLERANFLTIRYEDLVCNPENTCKELYEFLGVDFSPNYLKYNLNTDPYPNRWKWIPESKDDFNILHTIKWKQQMNKHDIERVNQRANWFIEKYRYELK
ncbi:MAG: sulfotransferase [Crocosphaera sp.]|nr:sulfotransferase [Crocosphaera sp.]